MQAIIPLGLIYGGTLDGVLPVYVRTYTVCYTYYIPRALLSL